jgi:hypothetical protein
MPAAPCFFNYFNGLKISALLTRDQTRLPLRRDPDGPRPHQMRPVSADTKFKRAGHGFEPTGAEGLWRGRLVFVSLAARVSGNFHLGWIVSPIDHATAPAIVWASAAARILGSILATA